MIDNPGVAILSTNDLLAIEELEAEEQLDIEEGANEEQIQSSLSSHIQEVFQANKDARTTSRIDEKMMQSLRAYNGHYDPEDIARIRQAGGSDIYMNITSTKCRAAMSWIKDILMPARENVWSLAPTPLPEIPVEVSDKIRAEIQRFLVEDPEGQQGMQDPSNVASRLHETNQLQMDLEEAISDEIFKIASSSVKKFETVIADELAEGEWNQALNDFIEDFCVFQVAIMKGPIITRRRGLTWKGGQPVKIDEYVYLNKRVSPLDIYPSASAVGINDGDLCEHIRLKRKDLYNLIGTEGYKEEYIRELLDQGEYGTRGPWIDNSIEEEKTIEEYRGDSTRANKGVYHGIHFFGTASHPQLMDWGYDPAELGDDEDKEFDIEAILVGSNVIKCVINDDPLLRRPYYKAAFQQIPGSWWGRSLPELMRDVQRMCNATARSLSNNLGIASGPQVEVNIDRLAADEEIEDIYPFKIWQTTNDPTGAGGKAISFWQPSSNAAELLAVYKEFELNADDATGIPRYAHGNENVGGAGATASGLSMLLETASKGIKDAIRHIDNGLIIPRITYQFYWDMITNPDTSFTGDINVIAKGSHTLTMRAAQEMRRNEFLQILAAPMYIEIVGREGIAEILREMAKTLGLGENIVPSRIELRFKQKRAEKAAAAAQQQALEQKQTEVATGVKQVEMQVTQAEQASQRNAQLKAADLQMKSQSDEADRQLKAIELQARMEADRVKNETAIAKQNIQAAQKDRDTNKNIALSIESNFKDKAST